MNKCFRTTLPTNTTLKKKKQLYCLLKNFTLHWSFRVGDTLEQGNISFYHDFTQLFSWLLQSVPSISPNRRFIHSLKPVIWPSNHIFPHKATPESEISQPSEYDGCWAAPSAFDFLALAKHTTEEADEDHINLHTTPESKSSLEIIVAHKQYFKNMCNIVFQWKNKDAEGEFT